MKNNTAFDQLEFNANMIKRVEWLDDEYAEYKLNTELEIARINEIIVVHRNQISGLKKKIYKLLTLETTSEEEI